MRRDKIWYAMLLIFTAVRDIIADACHTIAIAAAVCGLIIGISPLFSFLCKATLCERASNVCGQPVCGNLELLFYRYEVPAFERQRPRWVGGRRKARRGVRKEKRHAARQRECSRQRVWHACGATSHGALYHNTNT